MNWKVQKRLEINDACRKNFLKYTRKAFKAIPVMEKPNILDLGCGTGVPTIEMAQLTDGNITAIDTDKDCIEWLEEKIKKQKCQNRISAIRKSAMRINLPEESFDIILAEGFLNIIGFEKGLLHFAKLLKPDGYFMIHDDFRYIDKKQEIIGKHKFQLLTSFVLDEEVWWNEYCRCLQEMIDDVAKEWGKRLNTNRLFKREKAEIAMYRKNPEQWRSVYFVLKKNG